MSSRKRSKAIGTAKDSPGGSSKKMKYSSRKGSNNSALEKRCPKFVEEVNDTRVHSISGETKRKLHKFTAIPESCEQAASTVEFQSLKRPHGSSEISLDGASDDEITDDLTLSSNSNLASSKSSLNRKTKTKYTPLEEQYLAIKEKYPDAVLFIECGYKYRFFGVDAEVAAEILKIYCHMDHNFQTASIPTNRLFVHVRRLVAAGYKVGVVKQTETAALKAVGGNKGAPFTRELTALYTKSTLIGEDVDPLSGVISGNEELTGPESYLMCVYDTLPTKSLDKRKEQVTIGIVAVQLATGKIIYDCFEDGIIRSSLETRLSHIQPVELLLPRQMTEATEKLLSDVTALSSINDDKIRIERISNEEFEYKHAFEVVGGFYGDVEGECHQLQEAIGLPVSVVCCLSALITYLQDFSLGRVLQLRSMFQKFSVESKCMKLPAKTMQNLEIFKNLTDGREKGTLLWVLDHTRTKLGSRLLQSWISHPLTDVEEIHNRQDAVYEIMQNKCGCMDNLQKVLTRIPDLEKALCTILHRKCSLLEFFTVCTALYRIFKEFHIQHELYEKEIQSLQLRLIIGQIPKLLADIDSFSSAIHERAARDNDKTKLFVNENQFPAIVNQKRAIKELLEEIQEHKREVRKILKAPSLDYISVQGSEFLIEVKNSCLKVVPSSWVKINGTKTVSRFHTPFIIEKYKVLCQFREQLQIISNEAWLQFLEMFGEKYQKYHKAVQLLAEFDCLLSLAAVAQQNNYVRPDILPNQSFIEIEQGKHPVVSLLLGEQVQYVPNDTKLQGDGKRVMIITGPNMGGKSSYIRQVALIAIMAQLGSFVPAQKARLGILDAIYTRMGAADDIYKGRSTFMAELQETSEIMHQTSANSLVILDELGRGTSTHDGMAIAYATLHFFIKEVKCLTLFVTHYPMLAEYEEAFPLQVENYHMSFLVHDDLDVEKVEALTFLYQLVAGVADHSYGLNVARLADVPMDILKMAGEKSHELERKLTLRRHSREAFLSLFFCPLESIQSKIEKLKHVGQII